MNIATMVAYKVQGVLRSQVLAHTPYKNIQQDAALIRLSHALFGLSQQVIDLSLPNRADSYDSETRIPSRRAVSS